MCSTRVGYLPKVSRKALQTPAISIGDSSSTNEVKVDIGFMVFNVTVRNFSIRTLDS